MNSHRASSFAVAVTIAFVLAAAVAPAYAQTGKLKVRVTPKQAYVFVDGRAVGNSHRTINLSAGDHEVGVYNYGYKPDVQRVSVTAGQTTTHTVSLSPVGGQASAPWGRIQLEGFPNSAAVLLNGKKPDYLVGHTDEFNHNIIWKQELLVPPGTHQLTVTREGSEVWSGEVSVAANQRVIIEGGSQKTTPWDRGQKLGSVPRFRAGVASATVAVLPVEISSFTASPSSIKCLDPSPRLDWATKEAVDVELDGKAVSAGGQQLVSPKATTTYSLSATGPGGREQKSVTVNVDPTIQASVSVSPNEIRYRQIGEKVIEHGTANLKWSTDNADNVTIDSTHGDGLGSVSASGTRGVQPKPHKQDIGEVNETAVYTLKASNPCGGNESRAANLRITGSIEPIPEVVLASVFFPTDYPDKKNPNLGLLRSQKRTLSLLADGFKKYLEYDPSARLRLEAHADERRSDSYNQELSERRASIVKQYLVDQGISSANLETQGLGEGQNLERSTVQMLEEQNPNAAPRQRLRARHADWLAHNRRVDVVLRPTGETSERYYPHNADDSGILWQVPKPARGKVEQSQ